MASADHLSYSGLTSGRGLVRKIGTYLEPTGVVCSLFTMASIPCNPAGTLACTTMPPLPPTVASTIFTATTMDTRYVDTWHEHNVFFLLQRNMAGTALPYETDPMAGLGLSLFCSPQPFVTAPSLLMQDYFAHTVALGAKPGIDPVVDGYLDLHDDGDIVLGQHG